MEGLGSACTHGFYFIYLEFRIQGFGVLGLRAIYLLGTLGKGRLVQGKGSTRILVASK